MFDFDTFFWGAFITIGGLVFIGSLIALSKGLRAMRIVNDPEHFDTVRGTVIEIDELFPGLLPIL